MLETAVDRLEAQERGYNSLAADLLPYLIVNRRYSSWGGHSTASSRLVLAGFTAHLGTIQRLLLRSSSEWQLYRLAAIVQIISLAVIRVNIS